MHLHQRWHLLRVGFAHRLTIGDQPEFVFGCLCQLLHRHLAQLLRQMLRIHLRALRTLPGRQTQDALGSILGPGKLG